MERLTALAQVWPQAGSNRTPNTLALNPRRPKALNPNRKYADVRAVAEAAATAKQALARTPVKVASQPTGSVRQVRAGLR